MLKCVFSHRDSWSVLFYFVTRKRTSFQRVFILSALESIYLIEQTQGIDQSAHSPENVLRPPPVRYIP